MSVTAPLLGALFAGALIAPHLLAQAGLPPLTGALLWFSALCLRAVLAVFAALVLIFYVPATELFDALTHWCAHAVVPFVTDHLGFSGHRLGDMAVIVPALVLAISGVSAVFGSLRAARLVRRWLKASTVGDGPLESIVVGGRDVVIAAAGLRDPRLVVSAGALAELDPDELAAGLEHERGHIVRRHRYVLLGAGLLAALARPLPGTRAALDKLHFHLERDADEYALRSTRDPLALAGAICKAAQVAAVPTALSGLGGRETSARLRLLLDAPIRSPRASRRAGRLLAGALLTLALGAATALPAVAEAGAHRLADPGRAHACPD